MDIKKISSIENISSIAESIYFNIYNIRLFVLGSDYEVAIFFMIKDRIRSDLIKALEILNNIKD